MLLGGIRCSRGTQWRVFSCRAQVTGFSTLPSVSFPRQKHYSNVLASQNRRRQPTKLNGTHQRDAQLDSHLGDVRENKTLNHSGSQDHGVYHTLPSGSIRLLVLEPGHETEPVHCRLEVAHLSTIEDYEALSYTWGDAQITKPIVCSGQPAAVTVNLHAALLHLRFKDRPRVLWVDALCINQEDNAEKSQQVPLMSEIYSKASRVVIWLGEETEDVAGALGEMPRMRRHYNRILRFRKWVYPFLSFLGPLSGFLMDLFSPKRTHPPDIDWKKFTKLLDRPWFLRTWIIQEVVLPRNVIVCSGHVSIPWDALQDVAWGIYTIGPGSFGTPSLAQTLLALDLVIQERRKRHILFGILMKVRPPTMVDLLLNSRNFLCTNQRDKIYGLLGIAIDTKEEGKQLLPDYSRSVEDIYKDFVVWNVLTRRSLSSFSLTSGPKHDLPTPTEPASSRPSWVPDFANLIESLTLLPLTVQEVRGGSFNAAKDTEVMARFNKRTNALGVWGISVDSIQVVGQKEGLSPRMKKVAQEQMMTKLAVWLLECLELAKDADALSSTREEGISEKVGSEIFEPKKQTKGSQGQFGLSPEYWEKLWQTLMMEHNEANVPVSRMYRSLVKQCIESILKAPTTLKTEAGRRQFNQWAWHYRRVWSVIAGRGSDRHFIVTKNGSLGWAPLGALPGDVICALYGGKLLYVLRDCGGGQFTLVGDCYVHGMMKGEAMDQARMIRDSREFEMI